jgi:hypothetical protein
LKGRESEREANLPPIPINEEGKKGFDFSITPTFLGVR